MDVHRLAKGIVVQAPAKVNLFFEVLAKRSDGFHEIETLMAPITLYDTLTAQAAADNTIRLDCRWAYRASAGGDIFGKLPDERDNLATKAVELLRQRAGCERGIAIDLVKRIPAASGLAGGSTDAAAALLAANALWNLGWSRPALAELAAELGSDVPFFLGQGAAICRGRGERVEPAGPLAPLHLVVVRPPAGLPTSEVYARCRVPHRTRSCEPLVRALRGGNCRVARTLIHNQLEEAACSLSPWIARLEREFARQDCLAAQMSGSGTSYFGICRHARHARRVARCLQARGVGQVYAVATSN